MRVLSPSLTRPDRTDGPTAKQMEELLLMHGETRGHRRTLMAFAGAGVVALSLAACGGDDDDAADTTSAAPAATEAPMATAPAGTEPMGSMAGDMPVVTVDGVDYGFENLPAEITAGTMLSFQNVSDKEFHEMVVIRIPDEETRSVEELVALTEEEQKAIFGDALPALVAVAGPGEAGMPVLGDGTIAEPGRYAVVCFIPIGADPAAVAEAMQTESSEPPDLGGGPPHVTAGMFAEVLVTA